MRRFIRSLSRFSFITGLLLLTHPYPSWSAVFLWIPKTLANAFSFFAAVSGFIGAAFGFLTMDWFAIFTGGIGALIAGQYVRRVTAPHAIFDRTFGSGWEAQIPASIKNGFLPTRWAPLRFEPPDAVFQPDIAIDVPDEEGEPLLADLWRPATGTQSSGMGIIFLHGSGWHYAHKDMRTRWFFRHLIRQGHTILDLEYRMPPHADLIGMVGDVKRAILWMKSGSDGLQINPERVVLMGGSAGGHLALLAAYTPNLSTFQPEDIDADTTVRAVVSFYGVPDLVNQYTFLLSFEDYPEGDTPAGGIVLSGLTPAARKIGLLPTYGSIVTPRNILPNLIGGEPDELPELYELGSPITHVDSSCPPTLQIRGEHDFATIREDAVRLHRALLGAGVLSIYIELPNTEHGFDIILPEISPAAQSAIYDTERFLAMMI